jgi:hypothetical protein
VLTYSCLGIEQFYEEEWIVFRNKTNKFDDFLIEWEQKIEEQISAGHSVPLIAHIHKEIKEYMVCDLITY